MWDTQCVSPSPVLLQGPAYGSAQEKNPLPTSSHLSQLVESLQICRTGWPVAEGQPVRYLLFLKAIALGNMAARELTFYDEKGQGETADFNKEMELLLFDM